MIYKPIYEGMRFKKCLKCDFESTLNSFSRNKSRKSGFNNWCKFCMSKYAVDNHERISVRNKEYAQENKEKLFVKRKEWERKNKEGLYIYHRDYRAVNEEKIAAKKREWYVENAEEVSIRKRKYNEEHKEGISIKCKRYYGENREAVLKHVKEYRKEHKEEIAIKGKRYYEENKEDILARCKEYRKSHRDQINNNYLERYHNDIEFRLGSVLRGRTRMALKGGYKVGSAVRDLGCSIGFFRMYLESQFYNHLIIDEPMTWENYGNGPGKWQIDHIVPLSSFILSGRCEFLQACNFKNIQPLWFRENAKKAAKPLLRQLEDAMRDVIRRNVA